jgi:hypothetical protein
MFCAQPVDIQLRIKLYNIVMINEKWYIFDEINLLAVIVWRHRIIETNRKNMIIVSLNYKEI